MTHIHTDRSPYFEMDGGPLAHVWQIVDLEQSYRLACIAMKVGARTTGGREDYNVEPFSKALALHARLPGASDATADDYVFFSAMPLEGLVRFMAMTQEPAARTVSA